MEVRLLRAVDAITAVSTHVARELGSYGINARDVGVIGNGVDPDVFRPDDTEVSEGSILYVGRLTARKGLPILMDAVALLREEGVRVAVWLVGKGPLEDQLRRRASRLGLRADQVTFHGFVPVHRLLEIYRRSNVVVVPSRYEGLPTTLLEAMSCAKPVVAADSPGISEVISHGTDGWLVRPDSAPSLAEGIRVVLEDYDLQRRISSNARLKILEGYTWDAVAQRFLSVARRIAG